ncbi:MAG: Nucleotidyltransferase domain protein [Candidatus Methanolliviera sp. GoM_asphalt]|nr:MAG: Nucleotidyltransferase domain protein [Candidatus Methanolliviera sp. GoM_asphalt]
MNVIEILKENEEEIKEKFHVNRIGVFGSCARGEEKEESDVDLIVDFEEPSFDNFMDLSFYLEELFGRSVDILTPEGVKGIRIKEVAEDIKRSVVYV